ncbi:MAG: fibrobacter succinogenes major paralogous domain-containing protein [Rikenellaceae bacterium]|nr:fibrobacter succinogenes major paralogous domain-containing protein [Rikenellaceae bacterium]
MQGTAMTLGYCRTFDETVVHGGAARYHMTGGRHPDGSVYNATTETQFWSASPYGNNGYFAHFTPVACFPYGNSGAVRTYGFSVRCVRE